MPSTPRTPRPTKSKKNRTYRISDLIEDLETGDFSVYQPLWLLRPFGWNGQTVALRDKTYHLLQEAFRHSAYRALRILVEKCEPSRAEKSKVLLMICQAPEMKTLLLHLMLDHDAETSGKDSQGRSLLHVAYGTRQASLEFLSLLSMHMNVNLTNKQGDTMLHQAIRSADFGTARLLLKRGADPDLLDGQGQLPLVTAAHLTKGDQCLRLLIRYGANVNAVDGSGRSALSLIENPAASLCLLERGARSDVPDPATGVTPVHTAFSMWCRWRRGDNLSIILFNEKTLASLLWKQALSSDCVNLTDQFGRTPLHHSCEVAYSPAPEYVQAMVEVGASIDSRDRNGWTPLHVAMAFGSYGAAVKLIALGAEMNAKDPKGRTPLHLLGMDAMASRIMPQQPLTYSVRVMAFGTEAPPPPFVAPLSAASAMDAQSPLSLQEEDEHRAEVQKAAQEVFRRYLYSGFDFLTLDDSRNMAFFEAGDDTLRFLLVQAAACQGLF